MVQGQEEFPVLTRSRRVSPEILRVLQRIDTGSGAQTSRAGRSPTQLDELTMRTLPEIVERAVGADHPEFAKILHRLAVSYHARGNPQKAEFLYRRALHTAERAFSEPNLELGLIMNNLGRVLYDQKKFSEAERFYERSLVVLHEALGEAEHPKLATPLSNLASLYLDQEKWELAEEFYGRSITILEKALGPEHPKVAKTRKKLAVVRQRKNVDRSPESGSTR